MRLTLALLAVCLSAKLAHAATYTVDNANPNAADFDSLSKAVDVAQAGDTLLISGSPDSYGSVTLTKELHLIGPGWYLKENYPDASPTVGAVIDKVIINSLAGAGSSLTSLQIGNIDLDNTSNILVQRIGPTYESGNVYLTAVNVTDSTFRQNYRLSLQGGVYNNKNSGLKVLNNVFTFSVSVAAYQSDVSYNVIRSSNFTLHGATVRYNILYPETSCTIALDNCIDEFNIVDGANNGNGSSSYLWPGEKNVNKADRKTFFQSGTFDSQYRLAANSQAANIDGLGTDAGIFEGDHPYVLSGMPSVPIVYSVSAPATIEAGETFSLSLKVTAEAEPEDSTDNTDLPL